MRLLFEIGTEELPAGEVDTALTAFADAWRRVAMEAGLSHGRVRTLGTPRRLALTVEDVARAADDREEVLTGPAARIAFDAEGNPTRAAEGFARGKGVSLDDLFRMETDKGSYVAARVQHRGASAREVASRTLEAVLPSLPWKRSMSWGWGKESFARPVRWLVALLDDEVVAHSYGGVESGRETRGHRFLAPHPIPLAHADTYEAALRDAFVVVDVDERREAIREGLNAQAEAAGLCVREDEALLDEVVHLVEWPEPMLGTFPEALLELPPEVLITSMRSHQRYFAVEDESGALRNAFAFVSNMKVDDPSRIVAGNLRVLLARLEDARFFFREDRKRKLADRVADLERVVFVEGLGSVQARSRRIRRLVDQLVALLSRDSAEPWGDAHRSAQRAAELCKADLTTGMVGEFPDLQGVMGYWYARNDGEADAVALAIREHYMPRDATDALPSSRAGVLVALADRLDLLAGCFSLGLQPSGSADPYGLRRAALGTIRILEEHRLRLPLRDALRSACEGLPPGDLEPLEATVEALRRFLLGRARARHAAHAPSDLVDAVLAVAEDDLPSVPGRIAALRHHVEDAGFTELAEGFKRVVNILAKAEAEGFVAGPVNTSLLEGDAERALHRAAADAEVQVDTAMSREAFADAAATLVGLKAPIDAFFDATMVNVDDRALRENRLSLLAGVRTLFLALADISRVQAG